MTTSRRDRPLRVAFFPLMPRDTAAVRAWCERPLEHLAEENITGKVFEPASPALAERFTRPRRGSKLLTALYAYFIVLPRRLVQLPHALRHDAFFVQRGLLHYKSAPVLEMILWLVGTKLLGKPIVYHLDDALWTVARPRWYGIRCRIASTVVTGNEIETAAFARRSGAKRIAIIEYAVDPSRYAVREHAPRTPVTLGYTGLAADQHLGLILDALVAVCADGSAQLKVVSGTRFTPPQLDGQVVWEPWTIEREFSLFDDFDIGLMPIADTPYNRGKESYKLKEYMAAGIPIVASPVGYNAQIVRDGINGFLARDTAEWAAHLRRLVEDAVLRAELGARGRSIVEERYTERAHARALGAVFREALDVT